MGRRISCITAPELDRFSLNPPYVTRRLASYDDQVPLSDQPSSPTSPVISSSLLLSTHRLCLLALTGLALVGCGIAGSAAPTATSTPPPPTPVPSPTVTLTPTATSTPLPPTLTLTPTQVPPTPTITPTPVPANVTRGGERQIAAPGGIGNTINDFRTAFGPGEQLTGSQAIYQYAWKEGDLTLRVQFWLSRRAGGLRVELPGQGETLERALPIAKAHLPYEAEIVSQTSPTLLLVRSKRFTDVMPDELMDKNDDPGNLYVRYNLVNGRVASMVIGAGHPSG